VEMFLEYPPSVTAAVTSPRSGMQCDAQFARFCPNTPQIRAALDRQMRILTLHNEKMQRERLIKEGRTLPPHLKPGPTAEERAKHVSQLRAKHPNLFRGEMSAEPRPGAFRSLAELAAEVGMTAAEAEEKLAAAERASRR
jgi:hypothetical protein